MIGEKLKRGISISLWTILIISFIIYFVFHTTSFISDIFPEFIGISLFALIIYTSVRKNMPLVIFYSIFSLILIASVFGYIYGRVNSVQALIDITPELIGVTSIALLLTVIFQKKIAL